MNQADVEADLSAASLRPAARLRAGWETAPAGKDVVVFWARAGATELPDRPTRMAGLGAVIDALTGRYQLSLQGASHIDGGPVCVRVCVWPDDAVRRFACLQPDRAFDGMTA